MLLNILSDLNLPSWVILRADHEVILFGRGLGRSSGLTLVHVASCEVQLGSAHIAWKEKRGTKH